MLFRHCDILVDVGLYRLLNFLFLCICMSSGEWFRLLYLLLYGCFADVVVVVDVVRSGEACSFLHRISFVLQVGERSRKVSLVVRRDDGAGRCCEVDDHVAFAADRVAVLVRQGHVALVDPLSFF